MDDVTEAMSRILAAKEARRRQLAREPFPVKVRVLVRLQELAAPILRQRGRRVQVWEIERTRSRLGDDS
jgi:hypothetical protein